MADASGTGHLFTEDIVHTANITSALTCIYRVIPTSLQIACDIWLVIFVQSIQGHLATVGVKSGEKIRIETNSETITIKITR